MKRILVIVDMQNDFTTGVLGNQECEAVIPEIVNLVKSRQYDKIFLTRDTHHEDYADTQEGRYLPVAHCQENTEGWQIAEPVRKACLETYDREDIILVNKPAFGSLELSQKLKEYCRTNEEETQIHFAGVCTGICVISNVLIAKAALPEVKISVIEKACACVTPDSHRTAIAAMKTCQVDII